ncbi:MAG: hypothetical protein JXQ73_05895 [Phycisphaerae bacterium]|nr:hypothetical protein [Phycisphaerae bacterium]
MTIQNADPQNDSERVPQLERQVRRLRLTLIVGGIVAVLAVIGPWVGCIAWMACEVDEDFRDSMPVWTFTDANGQDRAVMKWTGIGAIELHVLEPNAVWKLDPNRLAADLDGSSPSTQPKEPPF